TEWINGISEHWAGEKLIPNGTTYHVSVTVDVVSSTDAMIVHYDPSRRGASTPRIFTRDANGWVAAHEFGHRLHLPDLRRPWTARNNENAFYWDNRHTSIMGPTYGLSASGYDVNYAIVRQGELLQRF